ncbi:MAG: hypothetical protein WCE90_01360 [Candidatus Zixiibacteriota bacterium]
MKIVLDSIVQGVRNAWRNKFLTGIMFLFNLVFSLAVLFPLYMMFSKSFATNVKAFHFLNSFDPSLFMDFAYYWRKTLAIYVCMVILLCAVAVTGVIFLSGGFWGILRDEVRRRKEGSAFDLSRPRMERFLGYCGRYFWGMFKIWWFMVILYLMALVLFLVICAVFGSLAGKASFWPPTSWRAIVKILIGAVLFLLVNMIGDYLKIFFIEHSDESFLHLVKKTSKFLLTNPLGALSLRYSLALISVAVAFVYLGLNTMLEGISGTGFVIFTTFLVQQIFVVFRSFCRLMGYSSQLGLYNTVSQGEENTPQPQ